ncbi:MAG: WYL domain-containing protein [Dethiobacteria bacterium]|jgi:predicted DNA-binding transcriptional regulator YafY|nr:WYL domain-containing protein [Bacillota bacterium]
MPVNINFFRRSLCKNIFNAHQARWIRERTWHHSQQIEENPDGSLILTLKVSSLDAVKRWVMSFGAHAEVLSPPELQKEIKSDLQKMLQFYSN